MRSSATGALVRDLGSVGSAWANDGLAITPDGRYVYLTVFAGQALQLERVDIRTDRRSIVAAGGAPALSFDGRKLAFAAGDRSSTVLAVRRLASRRERRIDLGRLLGRSYDLSGSSIVWTRGGSAIYVLASSVVHHGRLDRIANHESNASNASSCTHAIADSCLIEISWTRSGRWRAARVALPSNDWIGAGLALDDRRAEAVFLERLTPSGSELDELDVAQRRAHAAHVVSLPHALVVAVDPSGTRVMYVDDSRKPALWSAGISGGRPVQKRELVANVGVAVVSW